MIERQHVHKDGDEYRITIQPENDGILIYQEHLNRAFGWYKGGDRSTPIPYDQLHEFIEHLQRIEKLMVLK